MPPSAIFPSTAPANLRSPGSPESSLKNLLGLCLLSGLCLGGVLVLCVLDVERHRGILLGILVTVLALISYMTHGITGALASIRRETSRRHDALVRSRADLRRLLDGTPDIILHVDQEGRCLFANRAWGRALGFGDPTGDQLASFVHPEDHAALHLCLQAVAKSDQAPREPRGAEEIRMATAGGDVRRQQLHVHRIEGSNPKSTPGLIIVLRDVTEQQAAREEANTYRQQLLQAQKMESLGTLAGGIAHDFNNLLGAILGFASHARSQVASNDRLARPLDIIEKSARRGADLTQRLLAFARRGPHQLQAVNLKDVLENLEVVLRHTLDKRVELHVHVDPDVPSATLDVAQLEQAIMNLCVNAQDAMPEGGRLTVTAGRGEEGGRPVICLSVEDTGEGVPQEIQDRIFEPFFTTKPKGKGTGLGLSMVWGVARNHGGSVHVVSRRGRGALFKLVLPATEGPSSHPTTTSIAICPVDRAGATILVAEDEPSLRQFLETVLEPGGYRLLLAKNGWEALEQFERYGPEIDLVILDLVMPGVSGPEVFRQIRKSPYRPRVLITSGYSEEARIDALLQDGADAFLAKPYDVTHLVNKVRELVGVSATHDSEA